MVEVWELSHIEHAVDHCIIAPTMATAAKMLAQLAGLLNQYQMQVETDKTFRLQVGAEEDNLTTLEAAGQTFRRTSKINYHGSKISGTAAN